MTSYVELVLSVFLLLVVVALTVRLITQSVPQLWSQQMEVMYYVESAMTLAIGIEFVKMLCTHTPETIIEILLFAISRQMIVEHLSTTETIIGVGAIASRPGNPPGWAGPRRFTESRGWWDHGKGTFAEWTSEAGPRTDQF